MTTTIQQLEAVLHAARLVLERRADQMLTGEEWDALEAAVAACDKKTDDGESPEQHPEVD
ncbi:MAG: hypothetical protein AB7G11_17900 [Phycisphaerales bacterium]